MTYGFTTAGRRPTDIPYRKSQIHDTTNKRLQNKSKQNKQIES
ncbi:MAG: hypothetical protein ACOYOT_08185 [Bacteroidales bacterium]